MPPVCLCVRDIIFALQVANIQHTCKSCTLLNSKHLALFEFWQGFSPAYCYYIFPLFDLHWWQMSSCFSKSLENAAIAPGLPIFHPLSSRHENEEKVPKWSCPWKHESIMGAHVHGPSPRDLRRNHFLEGRIQPWNPFVMRVPCFGGKSLWVSHGLLGGETDKLLAPL